MASQKNYLIEETTAFYESGLNAYASTRQFRQKIALDHNLKKSILPNVVFVDVVFLEVCFFAKQSLSTKAC
ncbi:MAG: hypothetical protein ACRCUY_04785 [Thermoguttaceae bacterium]